MVTEGLSLWSHSFRLTLYALKATSRATQPDSGKLLWVVLEFLNGSRQLQPPHNFQTFLPVSPTPGHLWGREHKLIAGQGQIGTCHRRARLGSRGSMAHSWRETFRYHAPCTVPMAMPTPQDPVVRGQAGKLRHMSPACWDCRVGFACEPG